MSRIRLSKLLHCVQVSYSELLQLHYPRLRVRSLWTKGSPWLDTNSTWAERGIANTLANSSLVAAHRV